MSSLEILNKKRGASEQKISVCTPVRNSAQDLPQSFRCLEAQTVQPFEYVVCIGKSDDETELIVKEFQKNSKVPVRIVYDHEGIGTGYARNLLAETAEGTHIAWIDSDVLVPINWIEALKKLIETHSDIDAITSPAKNVIEITKEQSRVMRQENMFPRRINMESLKINEGLIRMGDVIKRDTILKVGGFDSYFVRGQDTDLLIRLKASGASGALCDGLRHLHTGFVGSYKKALNRSSFPKLIYKYGPRCITYVRNAFFESLLRLSVFFSLLFVAPLYFVGFTAFGLTWSLFSLCALLIGTTLKYGFNPKIYAVQMIKCFAEIYLWVKILTDDSRKGYGYGKSIWSDQK